MANEFDINLLYQQLYGYVGPPFPEAGNANAFIPSSPLGTVESFSNQFKKDWVGKEMIMPVKFSIPGFEWDFPFEPIVSLRMANKVIRKYPKHNNGSGSIKESWGRDDYRLIIKGALLDLTNNRYPEDQLQSLKRFLTYRGSIKVECPVFRIFDIEYLAIENVDIPHSTGIAIQKFTINAYSDQLFDSLLIET